MGSDPVKIDVDRKLPGPFQKYSYGAFINSPSDMGMSGTTSGWGLDTIGDNFGGLISYIQLLVTGTSRASKAAAIDSPLGGPKNYQPLGNAYVFNTGFTCKDSNGTSQDAVAYINNIPLGNIPLISSFMGAGNIQELRGLLPGIFENLNGFNPMIIVGALDICNNEPCNKEVETDPKYSLPTTNIDQSDGQGYERGKPKVEYSRYYMFDSLVANIDPCLFRGDLDNDPSSRQNPVTKKRCREAFTNINNNNISNSNKILQNEIDTNLNMLTNLSKNDWIIQLYYISISILIIFILIKILNKNRI